MKFTVTILLTALSGFVCGLYLPWWSVGAAAFLVAIMIYQPPVKAFLTGAAGIFLLWGILSWIIDSQNQGLLSAKVASILPLNGSPFLLILFTAFIGSLVGGMGAISGSFLRRI